jgi:drug/metabolite transporter (DMT)-like permease
LSQISSKKIVVLVYASVFLSAVFGGAGFVFMKHALAVFPTIWFIFWRFFLSVVFLFPFLAGRAWKAPRHTLKDGLVAGGLYFAATFVQVQGIARADAGRSAFINSASVVVVPILQAVILRRPPSWKVMAGCILCLFGVGFLTMQKMTGRVDRSADFLVFAGTCLFACQIVAFSNAVRKSSPHVLSFIEFSTIAVLALPLALARPSASEGLVIITLKGWVGVVYAALMMNIAMLMVTNNALRYITPTAVAVIGSMQSVYGALFGALILDEAITWQLVLSGSIILGGILTSILASPSARSP